jgi:hypothetical protein
MKSAYELAMGRLEKLEPARTLTDDQKRRIAEVDAEVDAGIAEKRIFLGGRIASAAPHERADIERQLASEIARLEERRERDKARIRGG